MTPTAVVPEAPPTDSPILRVSEMTKSFPGTLALDRVSLELHSGEILAVVGHNGSGKSTLVKILAGVYSKDAGEVDLAKHADGDTEIHIIHQDLGLVSQLNTVENLGLQGARGVSGFTPFDGAAEKKRARELIGRFGEEFDVTLPIGQLSPAQRSIIAIARALDGWTHSRNVLILDEPTEALHASEVDLLFEAVKRVAAQGAGVIFISHRLDEVLTLTSRVAVLRDGMKVADEARAGLNHDRLVDLVTGGSAVQDTLSTARHFAGEPALTVRNLRGRGIEGLDLDVRPGEIVGVAGVLGSGRETLPSLLFGATQAQAETFQVAGEDYDDRNPAESIRRQIAFVPGDRSVFGSIPRLTARENITLPQLRSLRNRWWSISKDKERAETQQLMDSYDVKPPRLEQTFSLFSGGNQQKIVFAKWMRNEPRLLILEEPTQGVDIGAKQSIYQAIDRAADTGAAVVVCSSDAKELVRLCGRVHVMRGGRIVRELAGEELTETELVLTGYGLTSDDAATDGSAAPSVAPSSPHTHHESENRT